MNSRSHCAVDITAKFIDHGDEAAWWAKVGVEPLGVANALWRETHPLT